MKLSQTVEYNEEEIGTAHNSEAYKKQISSLAGSDPRILILKYLLFMVANHSIHAIDYQSMVYGLKGPTGLDSKRLHIVFDELDGFFNEERYMVQASFRVWCKVNKKDGTTYATPGNYLTGEGLRLAVKKPEEISKILGPHRIKFS